MSFCSQCGVQLNDNDVFCYSCGNPVSHPTQPQNPPQAQSQPHDYPIQQMQMQQPACDHTKPKGKGFSITGLILSIFGLMLSIYLFVLTVNVIEIVNEYRGHAIFELYDFTKRFSDEIARILYTSILPIAALIFSCLGRRKESRNGISTAGITISVISLFIMAGSFFLYCSI